MVRVNGKGNGDNSDDGKGENGGGNSSSSDLSGNRKLIALPSNTGPRTIPDYPGLFNQAIYDLGNGIKVFAGTVDDPFYIDLGAAFDTLNLRTIGIVQGATQDGDDYTNVNPDNVSGYNVNTIAIEVPIALLTRTGKKEAATSPAATIGTWGTTSRPQVTIRRSPDPANSNGQFRQIQRMGNALTNELFVGNGSKDRFSMSEPKDDQQFARFFFDPYLARQLNAIFPIVTVPSPPRNDLLPLYQYLPPIAAPGTPSGPIADLLRLNTGVPPTPQATRSRLGLVGVAPPRRDPAGYPNGRRVTDDVTDITVRLTAGVFNPAFDHPPNNLLGDGVNVNDTPQFEKFPYVYYSHDGRNSRHLDPGEPGCTMGTGNPCPPPDKNP